MDKYTKAFYGLLMNPDQEAWVGTRPRSMRGKLCVLTFVHDCHAPMATRASIDASPFAVATRLVDFITVPVQNLRPCHASAGQGSREPAVGVRDAVRGLLQARRALLPW